MLYSDFFNILLFLNAALALAIYVLFLKKKKLSTLKIALYFLFTMIPSVLGSIGVSQEVYICPTSFSPAAEINCKGEDCTARVNNSLVSWKQPFTTSLPEICLTGEKHEVYIEKSGLTLKKSENQIFLKQSENK